MRDARALWPMCGPNRAPMLRRIRHAGRLMPVDLGFLVGAGEGNRTLMTSLEGWGSAIELRPRARRPARRVSTDSVPVRRAPRRTTLAGGPSRRRGYRRG